MNISPAIAPGEEPTNVIDATTGTVSPSKYTVANSWLDTALCDSMDLDENSMVTQYQTDENGVGNSEEPEIVSGTGMLEVPNFSIDENSQSTIQGLSFLPTSHLRQVSRIS